MSSDKSVKRQSKCEKDGNATNYEIMSFDESISNENASMSKKSVKKISYKSFARN